MLHLSLYHRHAPLPHHHRRSSSITTSTTKSCPLFRRTPSTAMEVHVAGPHQIATVRCMANQRRVKMVAKQIRRELSDMLLTDKVLQFAVLPEAALDAKHHLIMHPATCYPCSDGCCRTKSGYFSSSSSHSGINRFMALFFAPLLSFYFISPIPMPSFACLCHN